MKRLFPLLVVCLLANAEICKLGVSVSNEATLPIIDISFALEQNAVIYPDSISIEFPKDISTDKIQAPPSDQEEYKGTVLFRYAVPKRPFRFKVTYQACGDGVCYMPVTTQFAFDGYGKVAPVDTTDVPKESKAYLDNFEVTATAVGYQSANDFLELCEKAVKGQQSQTSNLLERTFNKYGFLFALLLLLPLGMLLNCTPCVLPLIPVNLAIIGATGPSRSQVLRRSSVYAIGMMLAYGSLGVVTVLTGSAFGAINSNPWFNFAIAAIFILLALSLFDLFSIDFSRWRGKGQASSLAGVFIMGGLTAILSSACVAPVLIWVIVLAMSLYSQGMTLALLFPFSLGLGMALPWPLVAIGIAKLPAPGMWMIRVRQAFGILMCCFAIYYIVLGFRLYGSAESSRDGWHKTLEDVLAESKRDSKPILIEFTGKSCKACATMDRTTFRNKNVISKLQDFAKLEVNIDEKTQENTEIIDRFKIIGAPSFVFLK